MAFNLEITRTLDSQPMQYQWVDSRKYVRYDNNLGQMINVDFPSAQNGFKTQSVKGFFVDSSFGGCSLVIVSSAALLPGQICQLYFEPLGPVKAKVVWQKQLSQSIFRIGCQYLSESS